MRGCSLEPSERVYPAATFFLELRESVFSGFPATNCVTMCSNSLLSAARLLALIPKAKEQHRVTVTMHWLALHFGGRSYGNPEAGRVWGRISVVQNLASPVLTTQPRSPTLHGENGDGMQTIFTFSPFHVARALHTFSHLIFTVILNGCQLLHITSGEAA